MKLNVSVDEQWPILIYKEDDETGVEVPDKLVQTHERAKKALRAAEDEIVYWLKYAHPDSKALADVQALVDRLPSTAERKAARRR